MESTWRDLPRGPVRLERVVGPRVDDETQPLFPLRAGEGGVGAESLEFGTRRRTSRPELEPTVGDQIDDRGGLGGADRVVVGVGQQAHAVADAHRGRLGRDRAVERVGRGAMGVLVEEVVLDGPERTEPGLLPVDCLGDGVLVRDVITVRTPRPGHRDLVEQREIHRHLWLPMI